MLIDIRPLPGMDILELRQTMEERLAEALAGYPRLRVETHPLHDGVPAFESSADSDIVRACEAFSGFAADAVAFGTEAPFLSSLGMETIVLGAGNINQAHQPDEYLPLEQVTPMVNILKGLIGRFCVE